MESKLFLCGEAEKEAKVLEGSSENKIQYVSVRHIFWCRCFALSAAVAPSQRLESGLKDVLEGTVQRALLGVSIIFSKKLNFYFKPKCFCSFSK